MLNLRSVDLNLLPVFEAAYEERSLSRAATRLAMTQPAVSHALTRLRAVFEDELFVRQSRGVVPTAVADRIYDSLHEALGSVRDAVAASRHFDAATSKRAFFVAIPHPLGPLMAVRLRERLARDAPGVTVEYSTRSRPIELERELQDGRVDAAVDWLTPPGDQFRAREVFVDGLVAMARRGHPMLRQRSLPRLAQAAEFVSLRPRGEREFALPALQEWQRMKLRVVLQVSEFVEILLVASRSDLIGPVPRSMLRMARDMFDLRVVKAIPLAAPIPISLVWHRRRESDAAHRFLRDQLGASAKDVASGPATE